MSARRTAAADLRPLAIGVLSIALLLLGACRTLPQAEGPTANPLAGMTWPQRRAALQARTVFALQGRLAVVAGGDGFNGRLHWVQQGTRSTVNLNGPLGVGGVRIVVDGAALDVTTSSGQRLDSEAARAELEARLGFEPPIAHLRYWIQGVPDPTLAGQETLGQGARLAALDQDDWHITYGAYLGAEGLPQRISFERGNVRVRTVIDSWSGP